MKLFRVCTRKVLRQRKAGFQQLSQAEGEPGDDWPAQRPVQPLASRNMALALS